MAIIRLPWSGEVRRLSVEPEGRVDSPEAKRPRRVGHACIKAVKEYIAGSVYVQKVNYTATCSHHRSTTLIQIHTPYNSRVHKIQYKSTDINTLLQLRPSKRVPDTRGENTRLNLENAVKSSNSETRVHAHGHTHHHHGRGIFRERKS